MHYILYILYVLSLISNHCFYPSSMRTISSLYDTQHLTEIDMVKLGTHQAAQFHFVILFIKIFIRFCDRIC